MHTSLRTVSKAKAIAKSIAHIVGIGILKLTVRRQHGITVRMGRGKERINIAKHGIDFATASHVLLDPDRLEYYDEKHSTANEDRFVTIGFAGDVLTVVYTERTDVLRIISARIATKKEKVIYYGN